MQNALLRTFQGVALLTLLPSLAHPSSVGPVEQAASAIQEARHCLQGLQGLPRQGDQSFCTGLKLSEEEIRSLSNMDWQACVGAIEKTGYSVIDSGARGQRHVRVPEKDWQEFQQSTQRALTFHDLQAVAFKTGRTRIDCLHELLHVYQWRKGPDTRLASAARARLQARASEALETEITRIEKLETEGDKAGAQREAQRLQPQIDLLGQFAQLSDTLDETEVYLFFFRNCSTLRCSDDDLDTVIANLDRRKAFLSPTLAKEIESEVQKRTRAKFTLHAQPAKKQWKPLDEKESSQTLALLEKDWDALLQHIGQRKVRIVAVKLAANAPARALDGERIPAKVFESLPSPAAEDRALLEQSKILSGQAAGKFLCQTKPPTIVITDAVTKGTLVHEFLHSVQNLKNNEYCPAVSKQQEVAERFRRGEIDKSTYEKTVLTYQATNALAEREVYRILRKHSSKLGKLENLNNEEMLNRYERLLEEIR